jgi:putative ABC transport system permease protein
VIVTRTQIVGGTGNWRAEVDGVSPDFFSIRDWATSSGDLFTDEDVRTKRTVVLLGATVAKNLWPDSDPTGQEIRLGKTPFTVIGVLAPKGQTANGSDQDDVVIVPYTTAQTRLNGFSFLGQILASASSPATLAPAQEEIKGIMRAAHSIPPGGTDDFTVRDQTAIAKAATSTSSIMTSLLAAIASVSLIVGGIGIMNIMLVSVTERTREIGVRKALGATRNNILLQFLIEALVLCLLGGIIGITLGAGSAILLEVLFKWNTSVGPSSIVLAFAFSAAVGVLFGVWPARRAAGLDPIQSLRYE